jgi:hypothetical protein
MTIADLGEEYTERKIRTYEPTVHKGESKASKYFVKPITKALGMKHAEEHARTTRLTA